jgi:hypothetical protein
LSESSTPRDGDPHRRAPDPAGTRPKVDLKAGRPALADPGTSEHDDAPGLGETFGPSQPASAAVAASAATAPPAGTASAPAAGGARSSAREVLADAEPVATPHGARFQFLIGALIALAVSALAITFLTLRSGRPTVPGDWSSWRPTATGYAAAAQIANHVGPEYRLASNAQMLAIQSGPLALDGVPLTLVTRSDASANANLAVLEGNAVLYKMCGLGASCSIVGTPTSERLTMVRREALELALDTFEYVGNANQVVVFLPPVITESTTGGKTVKTASATSDALFFQASDFRSELDRPLSTTLDGRAPTISTVDTAPDTPVVKALTKPSFYTYSIVPQAADDTVFLVLQPLAVN